MSNPGIGDLYEWFEFEETSGNRTGTHLEATLDDVNTCGYDTGVDGNNCADVNGSGSFERLRSDDNSEFKFGLHGAFTVVFFFRSYTFDANHRAYVNDFQTSGSQRAWWVAQRATTDKLNMRVNHSGLSADGIDVIHGTTISSGTWYFARAWHDPDNDEIGVNLDEGTAVTAAHSAGIYQGTGKFTVGGYDEGATGRPQMDIDKLAIFTKVLSDAEGDWLYNSGSGRVYTDLLGGGPRAVTIMMAQNWDKIKSKWQKRQSGLWAPGALGLSRV